MIFLYINNNIAIMDLQHSKRSKIITDVFTSCPSHYLLGILEFIFPETSSLSIMCCSYTLYTTIIDTLIHFNRKEMLQKYVFKLLIKTNLILDISKWTKIRREVFEKNTQFLLSYSIFPSIYNMEDNTNRHIIFKDMTSLQRNKICNSIFIMGKSSNELPINNLTNILTGYYKNISFRNRLNIIDNNIKFNYCIFGNGAVIGDKKTLFTNIVFYKCIFYMREMKDCIYMTKYSGAEFINCAFKHENEENYQTNSLFSKSSILGNNIQYLKINRCQFINTTCVSILKLSFLSDNITQFILRRCLFRISKVRKPLALECTGAYPLFCNISTNNFNNNLVYMYNTPSNLNVNKELLESNSSIYPLFNNIKESYINSYTLPITTFSNNRFIYNEKHPSFVFKNRLGNRISYIQMKSNIIEN